MSYKTIHQCANDDALMSRTTSAIAQEGYASPQTLVGNFMWTLAAASDIEAAYASALAAGNPDPGGDESVITDQAILGVVQAHPPTTS